MSFSRKCSSIKWPYELSSIISRVDFILYLGFEFNNCLIHGPHIDMICCKAYGLLGSIKRLAQDFKLCLFLKTLQPTLEYAFCGICIPLVTLDKLKWSSDNSLALLVLFIFNIHLITISPSLTH